MGIYRILATTALFSIASLCFGGTELQPVSFKFNNGQGLSSSLQHYYLSSRHGAIGRYNGSEITKFSLHQSIGSNVLHYATTSAYNEQHHYAGVSIGRATVAYFQGKGDSFSKSGTALYRDLNHYFFYGGNRSPFSFQGAGLDFGLTRTISTQVAGVRVKTPAYEDRFGYYAGITARGFKGGVFGLDRGSERIGYGFNFAFNGPRFGVEYQRIQTDTGAHLNRVGFSWRNTTMSSFSLDLEDANNPLYVQGDEQRVMFRYRRSFGRAMSFSATENETEPGEAEKKNAGFGTVLGVGVGVAVVVAAASSGSDSVDNSPRFSTQNAAAFDVLNFINPTSVRLNREHGGWVYRAANGTFGYTNPVIGTVSSVNLGNPVSSVPGGTVASASYHTHAGPDPRFDNENFSPTDIQSDILVGVDGYLGTPAGFLKYHELSTDRIITLGRIAN